MDHVVEESATNYNLSGDKQNRPFKRTVRKLNKTGTLCITLPADYVKNYGITPGQEYQFYIEVSR